MSTLGTVGTLLSRLPVSEWIALAASAPTIVSDAIKLGEDLSAVIAEIKPHPYAPQVLQDRYLPVHAAWSAAWTQANQRAADFQDGAR